MIMMRAAILLGTLILAVGCENRGDGANVPADNTEVNQRDRKASAVTPGDQGENDVDLAITQKIRQGVMKDDSLSMTAKNVKIITSGSVVTLRGPVKSDKERADIAAIAQRTEGVKRIDNQIEIASN